MIISTLLFTTSGTWVCPLGVYFININASGGGSGGVAGKVGVSAGNGGTGGTSINLTNVPVVPGTTYTITIGDGGFGGIAGQSGPTTGGDTIFSGGDLITITTATGVTGPTGGNGAAGNKSQSSFPGSPGSNSSYFVGGAAGSPVNVFISMPIITGPLGGGGGGAGNNGPGASGGAVLGSTGSSILSSAFLGLNGNNGISNSGAGGGGGGVSPEISGSKGVAGNGGNGGSGYLKISYYPNITEQQDIQLVGTVNGVNTIFTIPSGTWIQDAPYKIIVYKNGVKQVLGDDYTISPVGAYNTVTLTVPPTTTPSPPDVITADYYIFNT